MAQAEGVSSSQKTFIHSVFQCNRQKKHTATAFAMLCMYAVCGKNE